MSSNTLSGMRYKPSLDLLQKVVNAFMPQQKLTESFDIYLNRISEDKVIEGITGIFPEIELIYFPSKLNSILGTKNKKTYKPSGRISPVKDGVGVSISGFTFETCILILRQFLRSHEYIVKTKSLKRKETVNRIMSIIPPSHMIPFKDDSTSNKVLTHSDTENDADDDDDDDT